MPLKEEVNNDFGTKRKLRRRFFPLTDFYFAITTVPIICKCSIHTCVVKSFSLKSFIQNFLKCQYAVSFKFLVNIFSKIRLTKCKKGTAEV